VESKSKKLRSGYTTGACAAAAAKAATSLLLRIADCGLQNEEPMQTIEIPFPDGSRVEFKVLSSEFRVEGAKSFATASIVKDAGDDPDVTHGAEIGAEASFIADRGLGIAELRSQSEIVIRGGKGVGRMTKPGLAIPVGEPAINPVPLKMIRAAVLEALAEFDLKNPQSAIRNPQLEITISVPAGEELAKKTLNHRLGIVGGISILGTTGIVRPVSTEAYTASITASMDVAKAAGLSVVVLSSGRTSEKAHEKKFHFPEEAYVMMGDYLEFALVDAKTHGFNTIHLCAQWAKMVKTAMGTPQTHVRHGALEAAKARDFLIGLGLDLPRNKVFNTTREIYEFLNTPSGVRMGDGPAERNKRLSIVCTAAKRYAEGIAGIPVTIHLVSYEGDIIAASE
jgi:cobalt-precorrin-5B (C1)-methyltransferase